mmetsp:Transcript_4511/g.5220  ORF Transcript_4511/g.5220 Transcript_4511/m.5220 type:complete len:106 (+) Transcript_4511:94-411(+)
MSSRNINKRKRSELPRPRMGDNKSGNTLRPVGYLLSCDGPPVKQFIMYTDSTRHDDKKWVIQDLDETHLLINRKYKEEIINEVDKWMDSNVFSSVEKVGEDLDMS